MLSAINNRGYRERCSEASSITKENVLVKGTNCAFSCARCAINPQEKKKNYSTKTSRDSERVSEREWERKACAGSFTYSHQATDRYVLSPLCLTELSRSGLHSSASLWGLKTDCSEKRKYTVEHKNTASTASRSHFRYLHFTLRNHFLELINLALHRCTFQKECKWSVGAQKTIQWDKING